MDVRNQISDILSKIEKRFRGSFLKDTHIITKKIEDTEHFYTEIFTSKTITWDHNILMYLGNRDSENLDVINNYGWRLPSTCATLIVKYSKTYNKLIIEQKNKELRCFDKVVKRRYITKIQKLLIVTEKGIFTRTHDNKLVRLGYNSHETFRTDYYSGKELLYEVFPHLQEFEYEETPPNFLPSEFRMCSSNKEIINIIDLKNQVPELSLNTKLYFYRALTKKSFNDFKKYLSRKLHKHNLLDDRSFGDMSQDKLLNMYYRSRYPSLNSNSLFDGDLWNLIDMGSKRKTKLPHYKDIKKQAATNVKNKRLRQNKRSIINNGSVKNNIRGFKRLLDKLILPNFKFTMEVIKTNDELVEAYQESGISCYINIKTALFHAQFVKFYYKRETLIGLINSDGKISLSSGADNLKRKRKVRAFKLILDKYINNEVVKKIGKKLNDRKNKKS